MNNQQYTSQTYKRKLNYKETYGKGDANYGRAAEKNRGFGKVHRDIIYCFIVKLLRRLSNVMRYNLFVMTVRTRVAPSPTGDPHLGTLYQALFDYILARQGHGQFVLRIEDTDQKRFVPGSEERILDCLKWAGLNYDEGPIHQSERLPLYKKHALELVKASHAYYCFCTSERLDQVRLEQEKNHLPPRYDRHCLNIYPEESEKRAAAGEPYVIRMKIPTNETITVHDEIRGDLSFDSNILDDQVLLKTDGFPTYHLAVVVDDHDMQITDAVRGEEWLPSYPKNKLLDQYFGWKSPRWYHLPLLRNADRSKLSKRKNNTSVEFYIKAGYLPEALLNFLLLTVWGREKGQEKFSLDEAVKEFDIHKISMAAPIFDVAKLDWMNGLWIRDLSDEELAKRIKEFYKGALPELLLEPEVMMLVKDRIKKLSEFEEMTKFLVTNIDFGKELLVPKGQTVYLASNLLKKMQEGFSKLENKDWSSKNIETVVRSAAEEIKMPARDAFMTLRVAITGSTVSLPLNESMVILGKEEILKRLKFANDKLQMTNG